MASRQSTGSRRTESAGRGARPGVRKRNPRGEGERLRAALIDAAGELLLEQGSADGLSIRAVTARAGVSPTALYLHFADMEELLRAVCDEAFEELGAFLLGAAADHAGDPVAEIRAMGQAYIAFAQRRPGLYRILFATPGRWVGADRPLEEDPGAEVLGALIDATGRCFADDRDPAAVALQMWTSLHGYVSLRAVMPEAAPQLAWPSPEDFLEQLYRAQLSS